MSTEREDFEAWHVEYCSRRPRLDAIRGAYEDDKKAFAAFQAARATLPSTSTDGAQAGFVLVPVEPTDETEVAAATAKDQTP